MVTGAVQILGDEDAPEQMLHNAGVTALGSDQRRGNAHGALHAGKLPVVHAPSPHCRHGQEGGTALAFPVQQADALLGGVFVLHDDVLHTGAQGDLNGGGVPGVGSCHQLGHRSMHAPEHSPAALLQDKLYAVCIAFQALSIPSRMPARWRF